MHCLVLEHPFWTGFEPATSQIKLVIPDINHFLKASRFSKGYYSMLDVYIAGVYGTEECLTE